MPRRIEAVGRRIIVRVLEGYNQTDSGLHLARDIEEPYGYVLSVGPLAGTGRQLLKAVDQLLKADDDMRSADGFKGRAPVTRLCGLIDNLRGMRHSPPDVEVGDLIMFRRNMGIEFDWDGAYRIASLDLHEVLGVVRKGAVALIDIEACDVGADAAAPG